MNTAALTLNFTNAPSVFSGYEGFRAVNPFVALGLLGTAHDLFSMRMYR